MSWHHGGRQGAHDPPRRDRHRPEGSALHRPDRSGPAAGRGRRHHLLSRPQPLRILDRHRPIDPSPATRFATGCPAAATARSTESCTSWPPSSPHPCTGPDYYDRKKPFGKSSMEAVRCLKRRLSDISTDRCSMTPSINPKGRAREGNRATTLTPARPAHNPNTGSSDKPLQDPPANRLGPHSRGCLDTEGCQTRAPPAGALRVEKVLPRPGLAPTDSTSISLQHPASSGNR